MTTLAPTRSRHHATTCCVPGCDQPRHEITSRNKSRFCTAHYHTRDQRLQTCTQPKSVTTDAALDTLHALRPPKAQREYLANNGKGDVATLPATRDEYALKCKVWRRAADALVKRRGGRRRARDLDDVSRAAAMARMAELMAMKAEGAA